jgi:hypothetical protein
LCIIIVAIVTVVFAQSTCFGATNINDNNTSTMEVIKKKASGQDLGDTISAVSCAMLLDNGLLTFERGRGILNKASLRLIEMFVNVSSLSSLSIANGEMKIQVADDTMRRLLDVIVQVWPDDDNVAATQVNAL